MKSILSSTASTQRPSWRAILLVAAACAAVVSLSGCPAKPVADLAATGCPTANIVITLTGGRTIQKPGEQHSDTITVNVSCSTPTPGAPIAGAQVRVVWPGGSINTGTTDASGNAVVNSANFGTSGGGGPVLVSVNGSDDHSQNVTTTIQ
jgi:hypothetical protein